MKDSTCSETEIATKPDSTTGTTQLAVGGTFEMESGIIGYKFPFGKVDAADVPNDYVPPPINIVDGDIADCSDEETMIMTIPSSDFKTVCLFHGNIQKRSFLSIPDFPAPLPQAPSPHARYRITASTNHGLGMFATQDIALGDLVLVERLLLVVPQAIIVHNGDYFNNPDLTPSQRTAIQLSNVERLLTHTISRMQPQDRESFFELHNSHTEDGSGPIYGRVRTNGIAFSIDEKYRQPDDEGYYIDDEWTFENSGMFLDISRVNHRLFTWSLVRKAGDKTGTTRHGSFVYWSRKEVRKESMNPPNVAVSFMT
ncbi:hypothetical protein H0H93_014011 [Arthromyces matolae]|nr:hypothetical protein H0H93_014011 [Arthromyces matolae]